ncbi:hypothetical protein K470DRAFT_256244 [Piedraia hortae CBS 480.64]|uniref:PHD-type domain-containing protein n=1 Tax=Piedraia hortae CBS 480.64 TaxID=1314780 RepID=A0A6A7C443_9PEZI|nr:hypothetical protein K470DRAFT_256244 [Piedraia hortae CBS 480.64]
MPGRADSFSAARDLSRPPQASFDRYPKSGSKDQMKKTLVDHWADSPAPVKSAGRATGPHHNPPELRRSTGTAVPGKSQHRMASEFSQWGDEKRVSKASVDDTPDLATPLSSHSRGGSAVAEDEDDDAEYQPVARKKQQSCPHLQGTRRVAPMASGGTGGSAHQTSSTVAGNNREYGSGKLRTVVDAAVSRAREKGKPELASAVREIWQESLSNGRLGDLLEAVLLQRASSSQAKEFQTYVKKAKKRLKSNKKERKLRPTFSPKSSSHVSPSTENSIPNKVPSLPSRKQPDVAGGTRPSWKSTSNDSAAVNGTARANVRQPSPKRGENSDSSLTDLTEDDEDDRKVAEKRVPVKKRLPRRSVPQSGKDTSRPNSVAPRDRRGKKTTANDPAVKAREAAIAEKKQELRAHVKHIDPVRVSNLRGAPEEQTMHDSAQTALSLPVVGGRQDSKFASSSRTRSSAMPAPATEKSTAAKRSHDMFAEDLDSPLSELDESRLDTPGDVPRANKRAKTKISPQKKQDSEDFLDADAARKEATIDKEPSENNDWCSACGTTGLLLCCDGCDRAFHLTCLDPPISENSSQLNEPWYCFTCLSTKVMPNEPEMPAYGLFAPLLNNLRSSNTKDYLLPDHVREYFDTVRTGEHGNFMQGLPSKVKGRPAYDEHADHIKLKDAKGKILYCYGCGKSGLDRRPMIQCDYCSEYWHLDCLDPPAANPPPPLVLEHNKKLRDWTCPLHADRDLRNVSVSALLPTRTVHVRRPKAATIVKPTYPRGFRNNGLIEVYDDDDDEDVEEFEYFSPNGVIYKLPASALKADFLERANRKSLKARRHEIAAKHLPGALEYANFARRSFAEQQVALNLTQLAADDNNLNLGKSDVEDLTATLIAEAPREVLESYMNAASATKSQKLENSEANVLSDEQRKQLQMLKDIIDRRLHK